MTLDSGIIYVQSKLQTNAVRFAGLQLIFLAVLFSPIDALCAPVKIMPIGNSVTSGMASNALVSYRYWLWKALGDSDLVDRVDFIGSISGLDFGNPPPPAFSGFDLDHEGHFGSTSQQIRNALYVSLQSRVPDIALIEAGANDLYFVPPESTYVHLEQIIDLLRIANPDVTILLGNLIPNVPNGAKIPFINGVISALAWEKNTAQSPVVLIDHFSTMSVSDLLDGLHPNAQGEMKMAANWLDALVPAILRLRPTTRSLGDKEMCSTLTLHKETEYILRECVVVDSGESLIVEPGTVIKGVPGTSVSDPGTLVVAKGGVLIADGTRESPIVFTSVLDNSQDECDLGPSARGLWGGVHLLGRAPISTGSTLLVPNAPHLGNRLQYGGNRGNDFSGVVRHVSIRHAGQDWGGEAQAGLTLAGVGNQTVLSYIEVFASHSDGISWRGGEAQAKYLVSAFGCGNSISYSEGWRGKAQFLFAIHNEYGSEERIPERAGSFSGTGGNPFLTLFSRPQIFNMTFMGAGMRSASDNAVLQFHERAGGRVANSIFSDFRGPWISVAKSWGTDSYHLLTQTGELRVEHCLIWNDDAPGRNTWDSLALNQWERDSFPSLNMISDPKLRGRSTQCGQPWLDPRPSIASPALTLPVFEVSDTFFDRVAFLGAFGPALDDVWLSGWTALSSLRILSSGFSFSPMTGEITPLQNFDLVLQLKDPFESPRAIAIGFNGVDITSFLMGNPGTFSVQPLGDGGVSVSLNAICGQLLGRGKTALFEAVVTMSNGATHYADTRLHVTR